MERNLGKMYFCKVFFDGDDVYLYTGVLIIPRKKWPGQGSTDFTMTLAVVSRGCGPL